jgi:hypothetical protein
MWFLRKLTLRTSDTKNWEKISDEKSVNKEGETDKANNSNAFGPFIGEILSE